MALFGWGMAGMWLTLGSHCSQRVTFDLAGRRIVVAAEGESEGEEERKGAGEGWERRKEGGRGGEKRGEGAERTVGRGEEMERTKKAKEMWFLCRQYTAQQALEMGLVNAVVPPDKLDEEVDKWCQEILALGPGALAGCKYQYIRDAAIYGMYFKVAMQHVLMLQQSDEAREGQQAFFEKRKPDFSQLRK